MRLFSLYGSLPILCLLAALAGPAGAQDASPETSSDRLSPEHRAWLAEVAPLLTEEERAAFLSLDRPHRREAFIEAFWATRDPFPDTPHNEFRETWAARRQLARTRFGNLDDDRVQALLLVGPPERIDAAPCPDHLAHIEIWHYLARSRERHSFALVFDPGVGRYRLWSPIEGIGSLFDASRLGGAEFELRRALERECPRGRDLLSTLLRALDWESIQEASSVPRPSSEWVATFLARSTELPAEAATFDATLSVTFPGRQRNRTVVQALIAIPAAEVLASGTGDASYQFLIDGEILRDESLFEDFRYRFELPATAFSSGPIPLVVQRYLRPGEYTLVLKIRDLVSDTFYRVEQPLQVPLVVATDDSAEAPPVSVASVPAESPEPVESLPAADLGESLLAEATRALDGADTRLTLIAPVDELLTGAVRVSARASGQRISKVAFLLDGRRVMSKSRPPYSVELNLGHAPKMHIVEALAYDEEDREVARDRLALNAGPHRFGIRLTEPRPGGRYRQSLRAAAEVSLPVATRLDRVEIYLNETRLATLYQPPFALPVVLPEGESIAYVRAVAYLSDGNSTEDLVFINAPENLERLEIDFVELYTSIVDRRGRPIEGLEKGDFEVFEDGEPQRILRFERVRDLPIYAALVIDTSTSMAEELRDAERAALGFFERVIEPEDRAAVWVFADEPELKVPLTNNLQVLAGGLSGILAEGETALYDSIVRSVFYFAGIKGKRALILITDGQDSASRHTFDEALEFARRSGIAVYSIGIDLSSADYEVRSLLQRLATETGGDVFFIDRAAQLEAIYEQVEDELRSQYLLAYQSPQTDSTDFRAVEVRVADPDLRVKTIPGYYP